MSSRFPLARAPPRPDSRSRRRAPRLYSRLSPNPCQTPFVWVLPVSDTALAGRVFGKVPLAGCADVADVAKRACEEHPRWGVDASQVELFRVPNEGQARAIQRDPSSAAGIILRGDSLFASDAVEPGSWLLARVPPPAAAPGASRRRAGGHRAP